MIHIPRSLDWKSETLFDSLLARDKHRALLHFLLGSGVYQPFEIHFEKITSDRIVWSQNKLYLIELEVRVDSRVCGQLERYRAAALSYYIEHGPFNEQYSTKYEAALEESTVILFSLYAPSPEFTQLLTKRGIQVISVEAGKRSEIPLNYRKDPLPLVLADLHYRLRTNQEKTKELETLVSQLLSREFSIEERLFLTRYQDMIVRSFFLLKNPQIINKIQEVSYLTETEWKTILKEKLYLLSPEERMAGLEPEDRLAGLTPEGMEKLYNALKKALKKENK